MASGRLANLLWRVANDEMALQLVGTRTEASTYQFERAILDRVLTNSDFKSALEDYSEALRLSDDAATSREIHKRLARLYVMRAARMPLDVPLVRATVISPNRYGYSLLRDYDKAIEHLSRGNQPQSECKPFAVKPGTIIFVTIISPKELLQPNTRSTSLRFKLSVQQKSTWSQTTLAGGVSCTQRAEICTPK